MNSVCRGGENVDDVKKDLIWEGSGRIYGDELCGFWWDWNSFSIKKGRVFSYDEIYII